MSEIGLPAIVIYDEQRKELHEMDTRVLRSVRDGKYLGDGEHMLRILAIYAIDRAENG